MKRSTGSTLLELAIAALLISIAAYAAGRLLVYGANAAGRQATRSESFENARIGLDFLLRHTEASHALKLTVYRRTDVLSRLDLHTETDGGDHVYIFAFDRSGGRLSFGGSADYPFTSGVNELANVKEILVKNDTENGFLVFTVVSADGAFTLSGAADIRHKKIN